MDLALVETGNGGDIVFIGNVLEMVYGIENMPYLGCFGGNIGYSTKEYKAGEERLDWWGNSLLFPRSKSQQINSLLENKLINTPLNSKGRVEIEQTMVEDLRFLAPLVSSIQVQATIISDDHLRILLTIKLPNETIIKVVEYRGKEDGDFLFDDINYDFFVG
jgi:hypothetical protein